MPHPKDIIFSSLNVNISGSSLLHGFLIHSISQWPYSRKEHGCGYIWIQMVNPVTYTSISTDEEEQTHIYRNVFCRHNIRKKIGPEPERDWVVVRNFYLPWSPGSPGLLRQTASLLRVVRFPNAADGDGSYPFNLASPWPDLLSSPWKPG